MEVLGKEELFLYLVDEYTGEPVSTEGSSTYPISVYLEDDGSFLIPVMTVGLRSMALLNKGLGLVKMFYPGLPGDTSKNDELLQKAESFLQSDSMKCLETVEQSDDGKKK